MFAAYRFDRTGEPWLAIDDAQLLEDYAMGCAPWIMAKRACRSEADVLERLGALGHSMADQPTGRRVRDTTWTRRV